MSGIAKRLFTVDDCYRMREVGILRPDERVELIHGEIIKVGPMGPRHAAAVDGTTKAFMRLVADRANVRVQSTVVLDAFAAPQPDLALLLPRDDFYLHKHPGPADILLIIEVSDESRIEYDTTVKAALYAIVGIHEYWVADLVNNRLLCHSVPVKGRDYFQTIREFQRGDTVAPSLLPDCRVSTDLLLP